MIDPIRYFVTRKTSDPISLIRASSLFDEDWYRGSYPDVNRRDLDPAHHYLRAGAKGVCDPGPQFSSQFYLDTHPKAARRGVNPLVHHLNHPSGDGLSEDLVLVAAETLRQRGRAEQALTLAAAHMPDRLAHSLHLLSCNIAAANGDLDRWCLSLNHYMSRFGQPPVELQGESGGILNRLGSAIAAKPRLSGPKISVLMAVHQAEDTVAAAVRSVLGQSWRNLELIVVDDASTDSSVARIREAAGQDPRVHVLKNARNVGPYVSKNIALQLAKGDWVTGLDSDEWAFPNRLERQIDHALQHNFKISSTGMLRLAPDGIFSQVRPVGKATQDGVLQHSPISTLFERTFLLTTLGAWDCARFGADAEMMARAAIALGAEPPRLAEPGLLSLDREGSLTNNPDFGLHPQYGMTPGRRAYRDCWKTWHKQHLSPENSTLDALYCQFPPIPPRYPLPPLANVALPDIEAVLRGHHLVDL